MDHQRKKQLMWEYKNSKPEMGILSYYCKQTGDYFLGWTKDTRAGINSTTCKLNSNFHPCRNLLKQWNEYGEEGFAVTVLEVLPYEKDSEKTDYTKELKELLEVCLEQTENATRIKEHGL